MPLAGPRPNPNPTTNVTIEYDEPLDNPHPFPVSSSQQPSNLADMPRNQDRMSYGGGGRDQHYPTVSSGSRHYSGAGVDGDGDGDVGGYRQQYDEDDKYNDHPTQYRNPYASNSQSSRLGAAASTIGPWDSASQRSVQVSDYPAIPSSLQPVSDRPSHLRSKASHGGLSYIDEEGAYYKTNVQRPASEIEMRGLAYDPAPMGREDNSADSRKFQEYESNPCPFPPLEKPVQRQNDLASTLLFATGLDRLFGVFGKKFGNLPVEQQVERKRHGIDGQRWPVAAWTLTAGKLSTPNPKSDSANSSHGWDHDIRTREKLQYHWISDCYQASIQLHGESEMRPVADARLDLLLPC